MMNSRPVSIIFNMRFQLQIIAIFLYYTCTLNLTNCKKVIKILGLYPFVPTNTSYPGLADIAVKDINANETILQDYNLEIDWKETDCNGFIAFDPLINFIYYDGLFNDTYYPVVFGMPCLDSIESNSDIIVLYNMLLFTFSAFAPKFSLSKYYLPEEYHDYGNVINGFITRPAATVGQIKFIQDKGWKRVAIVNSDHPYLIELGYELKKALKLLKVENILETFLRISDEEKRNERIDDAIETILSAGYRIILFNALNDTVYSFYCRLVQKIDYYRKFTFIVQDIYPDSWPNSTNCSLDTLQELVDRTFGFVHYPKVENLVSEIQNKPIYSHLTSTLDTLHNPPPYNSELWNVMGLYMYDGIWALALALNRTFNEGYTPDVSQYFPNHNISDFLNRNIYRQKFECVTGDVDFENGLRVTHQAKIIKYSLTETYFCGMYVDLPSDLSQVENLTEASLDKNESGNCELKSSDGIENKYSHISIFILATLLAFAVAVYIVILIIIIAVAVYKKYPPATCSEPYMNIFLLSANLPLLVFAVLLTIDGKFAYFESNSPECSLYCHVLVWLASVTCSLILGGVLAKALKLYALWVLNRFDKKTRKFLRFRFLVLLPILLASIDTLVIALWGVFQPIQYESHTMKSDVVDPPLYRLAFCKFGPDAPLFILLLIKVALIILSIFLSYHLRNITHKSQRYTFIISFIMYNVLFFSIFIVIVLGFVTHFDTKIGLASFIAILAAAITASIIGIPVLYYLYKDPNGQTLFNMDNMKEFPENETLLRKRIQALEKDLEMVNSSNLQSPLNSSQELLSPITN